MRRKDIRKKISTFMLIILICTLCTNAFFPINSYATPKSGAASSTEQLQENASARKELPIESNNTEGWPAGPEIEAEAAILMDVDTGAILYSKNIHEELFPASTTKLLTCLVAYENGRLSDMVEFSHDAVFSVPSDGSNMGMDVGQSITLEQCLYGILVGSANEVANAVAEHIAGSMDAFVELMNKRATEIGCMNSHFTNTNGLFDENHYTSAYDLALIAKEYFANDTLSHIANTPKYHFEPTETQPDDFYLKNKHALINGEIAYEGIKGGKTGYTDDARQTLVTCCEQNGMRLICVVLMEESPNQFYDTVTLFDYGYSNFSIIKAADYEKRYTINAESFFKTGSDIFGNSKPFLTMNEDSKLILPVNTEFEELETKIDYDVDGAIAQIYYSYNGVPLGSALIETVDSSQPKYEFEHLSADEINESGITAINEDKTIFVNIKIVLLVLLSVTVIGILIVTVIKITHDYHFSGKARDKKRRRRQKRAKRRRRYHGEFSDYDF